MGSMRFTSSADRIVEQTVEQLYISGFDRIPGRVEAHQEGSELRVERAGSESGNVHFPWWVEGHGQITLSTATLADRDKPYHLPLELARGKIGQLRNQAAEWEGLGLTIPQTVQDAIAEALGYFAQAVVLDHGSQRSVKLAEEALRLALDATDRMAACYAGQALAIRRRASPKLSTLLGCDLGTSMPDDQTAGRVLNTFNAANLPLTWRHVETGEGRYRWDDADKQIEWCRSRGLRISGGPLLRFDGASVPDWLYLYEDDFDSLMAFASEFVEAVVRRYQGQIDVWQCSGRVNTADVLSLSEEDKVRLAARSIELTRSIDPNTPRLISFDQPWAEYLSRREMDFPPLHFADALVRADLGLTGLMLEINVGYFPGGSLSRDPLEFSRLLDYWSLLGTPLFVTLSVPSNTAHDPRARRQVRLPAGGWSPEAQQDWVSRYLPMILAKSCVHGVVWSPLRDSEPHEFPHGGLFDGEGRPKPALDVLASIRRENLK